MSKPAILFFARGYQADFFPTLTDDRYSPVFVTLTREESKAVERRGGSVAGCFEADYGSLEGESVPPDYLISSFMSDRFLGRFDSARRHEVLGKEIAFWSRLLDTHRPAAVVNELVAIEISEVLLIECRKRNIPYLAGMNCVIEDLFYWLPNPMTISGQYLQCPEPSAEALAEADAYFREVAEKEYRPFYVKNLAGRRALRPIVVAAAKSLMWRYRKWRSRNTAAFRYEMYDEEYSKRFEVFFKGWFRRYDRLEDIPIDREVIFFPLHQEPEATLNYMSEFYANQVATIENILKCLTPNQVLVIKEHPVDKGSLLQRKFWDIRKRYSGLYYLPAELHGRQVLALATRVVTLTSTVGWEAAVTGRKVYVLGEIFYDRLGGIEYIDGFPALKAALRLTPDAESLLSVDRARDFVAGMAEMSYPGNPFPHDRLYSDENRSHVIDAIVHGAGI